MRVRFIRNWRGYQSGDERDTQPAAAKAWADAGYVKIIVGRKDKMVAASTAKAKPKAKPAKKKRPTKKRAAKKAPALKLANPEADVSGVVTYDDFMGPER